MSEEREGTAVSAGATAEMPAAKPVSKATKPAPKKGAAAKKAQPKKKPKPKRGTKAWKRWRDGLVHRGVRWGAQLVFFLLCPSMFSAAFNGVKYIFQQIGASEAVALNSFIAVMIALLGFTVLFGRFFCGYACAFGTLGDLMYTVFTPVRRALHIPDKILPAKVQRALQFIKYAVLIAICALCFMGVWASVSGYSPWTAFAAAVALSMGGIAWEAIAVLVAIMLGMAFVERFFCQFLCPLGAVFSLLPVLPCSAFARRPERCAKRCDRCQMACPVAVHPDADDLVAGECISCGRCADTCPMENVCVIDIPKRSANAAADASMAEAGATAAASAPAAKKARPAGKAAKPQSLLRIRGNEVWLVVVKAVLLLALFWILGMVDYLPGPTEVFPGLTFPWAG